MTKEERHLWYDFLRKHPVRFTRQKIFGNYIVDFYSAEIKMVIELDGSQHFEEDGQKHDTRRDAYLEAYGVCVFRIPNNEINNNFNGVCEYLECRLSNAKRCCKESLPCVKGGGSPKARRRDCHETTSVFTTPQALRASSPCTGGLMERRQRHVAQGNLFCL
jgi:very-short-patch-repair endonuclease